jgi:hypothetical protein
MTLLQRHTKMRGTWLDAGIRWLSLGQDLRDYCYKRANFYSGTAVARIVAVALLRSKAFFLRGMRHSVFGMVIPDWSKSQTKWYVPRKRLALSSLLYIRDPSHKDVW